MTVDDEDLLFNQKTCAKLLGISVTAFQRWDVKPLERKGREALYSWADVQAAAVLKRSRSTTPAPEGPMPPELEEFEGNLLRLVLWEQFGALSRWIPRAIALMVSDEQWGKKYQLRAEQAAAIVVDLAIALPQMLDVFLAHHHDEWFEGKFGMDFDAFASGLARREVGDGPRPHGEFFSDFGQDDLPDIIQAFAKVALPYIKRRRAALEKSSG